MLKHEESLETASHTAAQVRVTPEELAAAISRIEARKDAGQRDQEGTIPIGEAVQQLGLEATPEEVLAEVQAIRQEPMRAKKRPSHRLRLAWVSALGLGLIGLVGWWSVPHPTESEAPAAMTVDMSPPQAAPKAISLDPNLLVGDATGRLVMLSEVGDNQPVRCTFNNAGSTFSQYFPSNAQDSWTLIKHDGQVYVRGRTLKMSSKVFSSEGADVTAIDNDPGFVVPVTLPLDGFRVLPSIGNDFQFHAVNIHLDKRAYEKWQP